MTTGEDGEVLREKIDALLPSLREPHKPQGSYASCSVGDLCREAAKLLALIEPVMEENERLREALGIIGEPGVGPEFEWSERERGNYWFEVARKGRSIARAALSPSEKQDG